MKRLLLVVLLSGAVSALASQSSIPTPCEVYRATLVRAVDGDTYVVRVALGFETERIVTVRLKDYDAPERYTVMGPAATAFAEGQLNAGPFLIRPDGTRSFTRWVAEVWAGGKPLGPVLVAQGLARRVR